MLVHQSTIAGLYIQLAISILIPVLVLVVFKVKKVFNWKPFFTGVVVFIVFAMILEHGLHLMVLNSTGTALKWTSNPYLFALYGALAAGVFEEFGRYFGFRWLSRKTDLNFSDGLSYGLGHGGIEMLIVGGTVAIQGITFAMIINTGHFDHLLSTTKGPTVALMHIKTQLLHANTASIVLAVLERLGAFISQIALSLLVLYGVITKQFKWVLVAVLYHALVDFFAALYQAGVFHNVWTPELIGYAFDIVALVFIIKSKKIFASIGRETV